MIKPIQCLLLAGSLFMITGCPIPAYYTFSDGGPDAANGRKGFLTKDSCFITWIHASPWRDHDKKVLILGAEVENISRTTAHRFIHSQFGLKAPADTFLLNFTRTDLNNPFIVKTDTLYLQPGEKKQVGMYYLSERDYKKKDYKRSIEPDTLVLTYDPGHWSMRLQGKRNY